MISHIQDYAYQLTGTNHYVNVDISLWQTITIQVIGLSGTCNILGTNDGAEVTGAQDGTPVDSTNDNAVQAVKLTTGTAVTAISDTALYRIDPVSFKYLRLGDGSTFGATKVLIFGTKPR